MELKKSFNFLDAVAVCMEVYESIYEIFQLCMRITCVYASVFVSNVSLFSAILKIIYSPFIKKGIKTRVVYSMHYNFCCFYHDSEYFLFLKLSFI